MASGCPALASAQQQTLTLTVLWCRDEQLREKAERAAGERARLQELDAEQEADRVAALHEYKVLP